MKATEVISFTFSYNFIFFSHLQPNVTNGGVNKPPPYPVQGATMINAPPAPDPHTTDLIS